MPELQGQGQKRGLDIGQDGDGGVSKKPRMDLPEIPFPTTVETAMLSIMCPSESIGMIIGKGGNGLKAVADCSGCQISIQEADSMQDDAVERGVGLKGTLEDLARAQIYLISKLMQRSTNRSQPSPVETEMQEAEEQALRGVLQYQAEEESKHTIRWIIPATGCGPLIGKAGQGIHSICEKSGATIKVANPDVMPNKQSSLERLVYITGDAQQRQSAMDLLVANPKVGGRLASDDYPEVAHHFIPARAVGFVLGRGGESIKAITNETGCKLQIANPTELTTGSNDHKVYLIGNPGQIFTGRKALVLKVAEWKASALGQASEGAEQESCIKMPIPQQLIGHLIGKQGTFVREILDRTGIQVKILQDTLSVSRWLDTRAVLLAGPLIKMLEAQGMIFERMASMPERLRHQVPDTVHPGTMTDDQGNSKVVVNLMLPSHPPANWAPFMAGGPGPVQQQHQAPMGLPYSQGGQPVYAQQAQQPVYMQQPLAIQAAPQPSPRLAQNGVLALRQEVVVVTISNLRNINKLRAPGLRSAVYVEGPTGSVATLKVDPPLAGALIGKGGLTIRGIQAQSGAQVQVQTKEQVMPSQTDRAVTVSSPDAANVLTAVNLIAETLGANQQPPRMQSGARPVQIQQAAPQMIPQQQQQPVGAQTYVVPLGAVMQPQQMAQGQPQQVVQYQAQPQQMQPQQQGYQPQGGYQQPQQAGYQQQPQGGYQQQPQQAVLQQAPGGVQLAQGQGGYQQVQQQQAYQQQPQQQGQQSAYQQPVYQQQPQQSYQQQQQGQPAPAQGYQQAPAQGGQHASRASAAGQPQGASVQQYGGYQQQPQQQPPAGQQQYQYQQPPGQGAQQGYQGYSQQQQQSNGPGAHQQQPQYGYSSAPAPAPGPAAGPGYSQGGYGGGYGQR